MTTTGGFKPWGAKQRNELNRKFALFHEDPIAVDGISYEGTLSTDKTHELCALPIFNECDPRYAAGPKGHINKAAAKFRIDIEETGRRRPAREFFRRSSFLFSHLRLFFLLNSFSFSFSFISWCRRSRRSRGGRREETTSDTTTRTTGTVSTVVPSQSTASSGRRPG